MDGRLSITSWEGDDKVKKYKTEVMAQSVQFLGGKSDGSSAGGVSKRSTVDAKADTTAIDEIDDESIPF